MRQKVFFIFLLWSCTLVFSAKAADFIHEDDGIILKLNPDKPTDAALMRIQICNDNIIHITATRDHHFSERPSLIVNRTHWDPAPWLIEEKDDNLIVKTSKLSVYVQQHDGSITFRDADGQLLLKEIPRNGKIITPTEVMGERTNHIQQLFLSPDDEAFYGLGQHQNNIMNYKNHDVDLFQYNLVAVVPFLISNRNYGILWDNNSRTKFGDIRNFESLSSFELTDSQGKPGGLTADYFTDTGFDSLYVSRQESRIEHDFLDVNDPFPEGFHQHVKAVRWTGRIKATESGMYKFRLYCSGYTKMWLNDKLVLDSWRQNWLPWTHLPALEMKAGQTCSIKIEWIHTGGYIGLKCLTPQNAIYDKSMSLYSEVGDQIDYYFIYGEKADDIIGGYRTITGTAPMMPKWALGFWQCRERYRSQRELIDVVKEFRKRSIPLDNIVQDWFYWKEDQWGSHEFDPSRFPDPEGMIRTLHHDLNTKIMISVWPKFYVGTKNYKIMNDNGFLYRRNVEKQERDWVGPGYVSTFYDPYSQEARDLFWKQINEKLFSIGIDAWWLDATEPDIHSNLSRPETRLRLGPTAMGSFARYLNTYSLMNAKGIYEGQRLADPDQRVFILTRSAYAGQQRYSAVTWSGDVATRWYDLKAQIPAGLNFCLSGIPYWTTDIGGFAVEPRFERNVKPDNLEEWREFNTRWFQYGTFCPVFRVHGQYPYREMFNIAPESHIAYQTMLAYDKLRYRLMPYIYSLAGWVTNRNYTIMRGLVMDFGYDQNVLNIKDQFMFGPALLINPVTEYLARSRSVYLPSGTGWYDFRSGVYLKGGKTVQADAPYTDIPIFVKEGSIIPFGPDLQYTDEKPANPVRLMVYTGKNAHFTLYEDENTNYNYEKGMFSEIDISYNENAGLLTIGNRKGDFPGMLKTRTFEIVWIDPEHPKKLNLMDKADKEVTYRGLEIKIEK